MDRILESPHSTGRKFEYSRISFPERWRIEICWVCEYPLAANQFGTMPVCVGTTDGRVFIRSLDKLIANNDLELRSAIPEKPFASLRSREAINGIAFSGDTMALSSRDELLMLQVSPSGKPKTTELGYLNRGSH